MLVSSCKWKIENTYSDFFVLFEVFDVGVEQFEGSEKMAELLVVGR
jgi:hypothetical protein